MKRYHYAVKQEPECSLPRRLCIALCLPRVDYTGLQALLRARLFDTDPHTMEAVFSGSR